MIQARAKSEKVFLLLAAAGMGNKKKFFEIVATGDVEVRNVHSSHFLVARVRKKVETGSKSCEKETRNWLQIKLK